jgi:uncharacterized protein (TIGR03067 family)
MNHISCHVLVVAMLAALAGCQRGPQQDTPADETPTEQPVAPVMTELKPAVAIDPSADLEALQGWWVIVEDYDPDAGPNAPPGGYGKDDLLLIERNRTYLFTSYGIQANGACVCIRLDASQSPEHMDRWHIKETDGSFSRAIYRLEGDEFTVVYGSPEPDGRPTRFDDRTASFRRYRRCSPPKSIRLTGETLTQPLLNTPDAASIKRW